jgi:RNA polymerase primary sigma factor
MLLSTRQEIVTELYDRYQQRGFITENETLSLFAKKSVPLTEIDSLTGQLLMRGVVIKLNDLSDNDEEYDRGQIDFEALYAAVIEAEPSLKNYIEFTREIQPPQHREWQVLIPQYKVGNQYAKNRLFEMYMRSVVKIAYSFYKRLGASLADTIQDGNIGLLTSFEKYDISEHGVFPSYYPWWVMQSITRNMGFSPNPLIYFPVQMRDKLYKIYDNVISAGGIGVADLSSPALLKSVMEELGCTADDVNKFLRCFESALSIEKLLATQPGIFTDSGMAEEKIFEYLDEIKIQDTIKKLLAELKLREAQVLIFRYGLYDYKERTLEEVGKMYGVTRERIRQIESKALRKLRNSSRVKKLRSSIDEQIPQRKKNIKTKRALPDCVQVLNR